MRTVASRLRRRFALAIVAALALGVAATQALATGAVIQANDSSGFVTPTPTIHQGVEALFANEDDASHNVTADDNGPDGRALFRSPTFSGPNQARPVEGTRFLTTGFYDFRCTVHPTTMRGRLEVTAEGSPVRRPSISLKIKSKRLGKVVNSGRLRVKVTAEGPTAAKDISLKAKKGRKSITKAKSIELAAGNSEVVKLKLSKRGEKKLAELDQAKVKVKGTVAFGFGDKASKRLK